jgi:hypothetical protein
MQADLKRGILPEQHVMLEVHRHLAIERHVQYRDQLALEPITHSGRGSLRDLSRKDLGRRRHLFSPFGVARQPRAAALEIAQTVSRKNAERR